MEDTPAYSTDWPHGNLPFRCNFRNKIIITARPVFWNAGLDLSYHGNWNHSAFVRWGFYGFLWTSDTSFVFLPLLLQNERTKTRKNVVSDEHGGGGGAKRDRETARDKHRPTGRQTEKETGTGRQNDRQKDVHTDRQTGKRNAARSRGLGVMELKVRGCKNVHIW